MNVAEYITETLIKYGVTDVFGVPGGVILEFMKALRDKTPYIHAHLNYHEQMSGFSACGFAQVSGRLGVAYATRGPGICNLIAAVAEAFQESLPVLVITSHVSGKSYGTRFDYNQELNTIDLFSGITKYCKSVENIEDVQLAINKACEMALQGRKGPALVDLASSLWKKDIILDSNEIQVIKEIENYNNKDLILENIRLNLEKANRPVILIGDGLRHSISSYKLHKIIDILRIPVVSSRGSQDLLSGNKYYYGYIGSHGIRYANFILSKADYILSIGNRLALPLDSESYRKIIENKTWTRIDIDREEFKRKIYSSTDYQQDAGVILDHIQSVNGENKFFLWNKTCECLKNQLIDSDCTDFVKRIGSFFEKDKGSIYLFDVGNNEFWASRAYELSQKKGTVLISKSFGTLGAAIGRSIGVFYAKKKPVVCFIGDQGFQFNIQELEFISQWKLPISIIIINNMSSGMILEHQTKSFGDKLVHVDEKSGYKMVDIKQLADAYRIEYTTDLDKILSNKYKPMICELKQDKEEKLVPYLPKGRHIQDMCPYLDRDFYNYLDEM